MFKNEVSLATANGHNFQPFQPYMNKNKNNVDKGTVENCLCICGFAISIVIYSSYLI